jgi:hypothetical protein|tara:strand:- start:29 stop:376 length:348 start_codon:yes stop_codon:yes gene_type:complete
MYSRYADRQVFINDSQDYKDKFFTNRDLQQLKQYASARFKYPSVDDMATFTSTPIIWSSNSRLYKLASEFYGYPSLWWVIAWYNKKPTEAHFKIGDVIYIPAPLELVMDYFKSQE